CRVEPETADNAVVLLAQALTLEHVSLRPAGHDDSSGVDAVIADEIVAHHVVLDDVAAQVRRDDALANRVVPAGDVADERERKATAADDEGNDGVHLRVAERDRGPVTFETF